MPTRRPSRPRRAVTRCDNCDKRYLFALSHCPRCGFDNWFYEAGFSSRPAQYPGKPKNASR